MSKEGRVIIHGVGEHIAPEYGKPGQEKASLTLREKNRSFLKLSPRKTPQEVLPVEIPVFEPKNEHLQLQSFVTKPSKEDQPNERSKHDLFAEDYTGHSGGFW